MEIYDQHEQSERVRSWLKDNASAIIAGIVIGLGAIFGYGQWQQHKLRQAHTAAELFERVRAEDASAEAIAAAARQLREEYPGSGFAVLASMAEAAKQAESGNIAGARENLAWAARQADEAALRSLVNLRLARLELAAGKADAALKILDAVGNDGFAAERAELRGDILAALGRRDDARTAYLEAQAAGPANPAALDMKLSEFPSVEGDQA
ncbi:YfgM family protein [Pseudofulvimonas gallinarii]|jgi:predicted negative regulator of RcsB-dependent stress response|uniref:Putative negative regulator of RcsB-dependent stress response n=1 Tax=Pseudofulvimonas gallinarii TaxID=634155 RepID=A0A4R3LP11_9GAMM|nr:tetratricopeptide repeat protein [Pseudofulvimonas gallinarii]TCT01219.1 putative negative regulator of RcsB-dependent stress response [Pseudofulvimonas gallinarii]THD14985.1 hypothetical protein B1808_00845 [Pseudofulvimonas gallinarii]